MTHCLTKAVTGTDRDGTSETARKQVNAFCNTLSSLAGCYISRHPEGALEEQMLFGSVAFQEHLLRCEDFLAT